MKHIEIIAIKENDNPKYLKTQLIHAKRADGQELFWEMTKGFDSVHILIENVDKKEIVLVKQKRIPVLVNDPESNGIMIELCAGLVDKEGLSITEIAKEEVLEETGFDIPLEQIKFLRSLKSSVGTSGRNAYLFHAKVYEKDRIHNGGGTENEDIKVVTIPFNEIPYFIDDIYIRTDAMTLFALSKWLTTTI